MTAKQLQMAAASLRRAAEHLDRAAVASAPEWAEECIDAAGEHLDKAGAILFPAPVGTCDCHAGGVCRLCGRAIAAAQDDTLLRAVHDTTVPEVRESAAFRREYGLE